MRKKFCFIPHAGRLNIGEKVFCVWIGSSDREQTKRFLVENFASDIGAFFRPWDADTDYYLKVQCAADSAGSKKFLSSYIRIDVKIQDFYKAIIDGNYMNLDNPSYVNRNIFRTLCHTNPAAHFINQAKNHIETATSVIRKNLSDSERITGYNAYVPFCLILVLFLLGALLEGVERCILLY